jgi:hypothetical protein
MTETRFVSTENGDVHLVTQVGDSERTICGITEDAAYLESDESVRWIPTPSRTVSCDVCRGIIIDCRGVRVTKR